MDVTDKINSIFYLLGAYFGWHSVYLLYKSKQIIGYNYYTQGLYFIWGIWNMIMYTHLTFWLSVIADGIGTLASITYFQLAIRYKSKS